MPLTRRPPVAVVLLAARGLAMASLAAGLTACTGPAPGDRPAGDPVPVAVLLPPGPVRDAARMAIDEINASGGVLDRPVQPVDGPAPGVVAAFGCEPGAPVMVRFCPGDGAEPATFYTGSAPNQRVVPALEYLVSSGRTAVHLALGDDPFSRAAGAIVRAYAATGAVSVVGEGPPTRAVAGGAGQGAVAGGAGQGASAVLSTLDAAGTASFLVAYERAGLSPDRMPVLSLTLTEADLPAVPRMAGHLLAASYFRDLPGRVNATFVAAFRREYGTATSEPMETAYVAVHVWRAMVAKAGSFRADEILSRDGLVVDAPEGRVVVDAPRRRLYRVLRVGRVTTDGRVRGVWEVGAPVRPDPDLLAYPWASPPVR